MRADPKPPDPHPPPRDAFELLLILVGTLVIEPVVNLVRILSRLALATVVISIPIVVRADPCVAVMMTIGLLVLIYLSWHYIRG